MQIFKSIYHFYQYVIKPSARHRTIIKRAREALNKIRLLKGEKPYAYLLGMLRNVDPFVLEELILLCFKESGFRVKRNKRHTGDRGIDGTVFDNRHRKYLIQVKRYQSAINPQHVANFSNLILQEDAVGGYFLHTGRTGAKSKALLTSNIKLLSGSQLLSFLLEAKNNVKNIL